MYYFWIVGVLLLLDGDSLVAMIASSSFRSIYNMSWSNGPKQIWFLQLKYVGLWKQNFYVGPRKFQDSQSAVCRGLCLCGSLVWKYHIRQREGYCHGPLMISYIIYISGSYFHIFIQQTKKFLASADLFIEKSLAEGFKNSLSRSQNQFEASNV